MYLTRNKNVDLLTLEKLDDKSLFNFCISNPKDEYLKNLCGNEDFWRNRFTKIFGKQRGTYKSSKRTWKDFYLKIIHYLDKYDIYDQIENDLPPDAEGTTLFKDLAGGGKKNSDLINFFTSYVIFGSPEKGRQLLAGALETGDEEWIKRFQRK
jgi:hypothetical protein